jgi:hypothetical protein
MDLKRDIYKELLDWKNKNSGLVLELEGARQVGKTYILNKFASENYKQYFYINMLQTSGQDYLRCLHKAKEWEPGQPRRTRPLHDAFMLYDSSFKDQKDTVVVIDEIQESAEVYSCIRQFAREFQCRFIVTGSYLGKTIEKEYFLPAGDIELLTLNTLTFEEFLDAAGKRGLYETVDLYGGSNHEDYDELKKWYDIYMQIGGYPAVVKKYLETESIAESVAVLTGIIDIFIQESMRYFQDIIEINLFEQILPAVAQTMVREKKGSEDLVTELSRIVFKEESGRVTKKSIHQVIAWLYRSHIIGYCGKVNNGDRTNLTYNCRFYFRDVGVAELFLKMTGADRDTRAGILSENFVYLYLQQKVKQQEIAGTAPNFATYKEGELDFFVVSHVDDKRYGIEVKAGKSIGKTANLMLSDEKIDYLYLLKGNTYGGVLENVKYTIPIYLTGRISFDKGK